MSAAPPLAPGLGAQLGAPFRAAGALRRVPRAARLPLVFYTLGAGLVFAATGWALTAGRPALESALLSYVFPRDWLPWVEPMLRGLAEGQSNVVFTNATLMVAIACAAALLFPLKERVSRAFETGQSWAPERPVSEFSLAFQAFEETRVFLIYVSLQLTFFWIGLSPNPGRQAVAGALSTMFLWVQFALDFGGPALQRRRRRYADIARLLLRRPLATLLFGAIFSAPAQLAGLWLAPEAAAHPERSLALLLAIALVSLPLGVLAGTRLAAELVPLPVAPLRGVNRVLGHVAILALVTLNLASAAVALRTLHHMSQVLKCQYDLLPETWRVRTALLDPMLTKRLEVEASIEVAVTNPTPFDLVLRDLAIDIRHQGKTVATPEFGGLVVPAGERRRERLALRLPVELSTLANGLALFEPGWEIRLRLRVLPGTELPIFLLRPPVPSRAR